MIYDVLEVQVVLSEETNIIVRCIFPHAKPVKLLFNHPTTGPWAKAESDSLEELGLAASRSRKDEAQEELNTKELYGGWNGRIARCKDNNIYFISVASS